MFCFQSPFTRTLRSTPSTTPSLSAPASSKMSIDSSQLKDLADTTRRGSEAVSEGSCSSIQYIDQASISDSSSTDTLPGVQADYFESDPLSPGPLPLELAPNQVLLVPNQVLQAQNEVLQAQNQVLQAQNQAQQVNSVPNQPLQAPNQNNLVPNQPLQPPNQNNLLPNQPPLVPNHLPFVQKPQSPKKWRKKFLLRLKANDNSTVINTKKVDGKANSANDIPSLNGFSEDDDDDEMEDDEPEPETETEDGSSMPSSPATVGGAAAPVPYQPYYNLLLPVNGGMRQETTSTSSPQLSSGTVPIDNDAGSEKADTLSVNEDLKGNLGLMNLGLMKKGDTLDAPSCLPAARSCPNLEQQSVGGSSASGGSSPSPSPGPAGPRFRPIEEGDVQVCYLNHTRTLVSKILSSKFLRRWETHHLYLNDACLSSKTVS